MRFSLEMLKIGIALKHILNPVTSGNVSKDLYNDNVNPKQAKQKLSI